MNFLIAPPKTCSATAAARVQPEPPAAAPDAFTRLPHRLGPDAATRWREAAGHVERHRWGVGD